MLNYIKNLFSKDRSILDYLSLGLSVAMIIVAILYITIDPGELKIEDFSRSFSMIMLILGGVSGIISFCLNFKIVSDYSPIVSLIFYSFAAGRQFYLTGYPLADHFTGVSWFGGNLTIYMTFFIIFLISCICEIVLLFIPRKR